MGIRDGDGDDERPWYWCRECPVTFTDVEVAANHAITTGHTTTWRKSLRFKGADSGPQGGEDK